MTFFRTQNVGIPKSIEEAEYSYQILQDGLTIALKHMR